MASQNLWDALEYLAKNLRVFSPIKEEMVRLIDENEVLKEENKVLKEKSDALHIEMGETQGIVNDLIMMGMSTEEVK